MAKLKNTRTLAELRKLWEQGGKARQAQLTPKQRSDLASKGGLARWAKAKASAMPAATN